MGIPVIGWKIKLLQKVMVGFLLYFREKLIFCKSYITTKCSAYFLAEIDTSIALHKEFCRKFEYDWKRDLPDIAQLIDMKYPEGCEVILTYKEWFEAGVICDKKILDRKSVV